MSTNDSYDKFICLSNEKSLSEKEKKWLEQWMYVRAKELESLYVIYIPDCGCPIEQDVLLDRYPMSKKIISTCPECHKGCLMEISDPIRFYQPLLKEEYTLDQIKKMHVSEGPQRHLIEKYRDQK